VLAIAVASCSTGRQTASSDAADALLRVIDRIVAAGCTNFPRDAVPAMIADLKDARVETSTQYYQEKPVQDFQVTGPDLRWHIIFLPAADPNRVHQLWFQVAATSRKEAEHIVALWAAHVPVRRTGYTYTGQCGGQQVRVIATTGHNEYGWYAALDLEGEDTPRPPDVTP
jgi:hypothetical protein